MTTLLLGLLAETSIHPGAGRSLGAVDLPVAREAATDLPVLVGSSLKGALRDHARVRWPDDKEDKAPRRKAEGEEEEGAPDSRVVDLFGHRDGAGGVLVSDARLVLLPVRCMTGRYRWATSPLLLERLARDMARVGLPVGFKVPEVEPGRVLAAGSGKLFLEEREFEIVGAPEEGLVRALQQLMAHEAARSRVAGQVAVLHDDDFAWFARYGLSVQARNVLDSKTKQSRNLWYEETLPPDTLMAALLAPRREHEALLDELLGSSRWLQAGGNATVGQGWFAIQRLSAVGLPTPPKEG